MATIKEATDKFVKEFLLPNKQVYGVGHFLCDCCNRPYIEVTVDKNIDKSVLSKIPRRYMGYRVETKFGEQAVAQKSENKFKKEFEGKEQYVINTTKKGMYAIQNAPITGGYVPEDISLLIEVMNVPKTINELKKSERKYDNLEGLLIYLHSKGLISINGITSPKANDFSNIDGDDEVSNAGGRRRPSPRRVAPRRNFRSSNQGAARRHVNYVRRNYNRFYNYPVVVNPVPVVYLYDAAHPKKIKITDKGLNYLKKHNKGAYALLLSTIRTGLVYDEGNLRNSLKFGDWNRVISFLYGNKLIDFV